MAKEYVTRHSPCTRYEGGDSTPGDRLRPRRLHRKLSRLFVVLQHSIEDVNRARMDSNAAEFDLARSALTNTSCQRLKTSRQGVGSGKLLVVAYDSGCDVSHQRCVHAPMRYQKIGDRRLVAILMHAANLVAPNERFPIIPVLLHQMIEITIRPRNHVHSTELAGHVMVSFGIGHCNWGSMSRDASALAPSANDSWTAIKSSSRIPTEPRRACVCCSRPLLQGPAATCFQRSARMSDMGLSAYEMKNFGPVFNGAAMAKSLGCLKGAVPLCTKLSQFAAISPNSISERTSFSAFQMLALCERTVSIGPPSLIDRSAPSILHSDSNVLPLSAVPSLMVILPRMLATGTRSGKYQEKRNGGTGV
jgi:hypothetical protein